MTTQEYLKCRRYYLNHIIKNPSVVGFEELYTLFSEFGISSYEELLDSSQLFADFVDSYIKNEDDFTTDNHKQKVQRRLDTFSNYLNNQLNPVPNDQTNFASMVTEFITNKRKDRILDVGSGKIPHSSILIAKECDKVSSMDHLILSKGCLKKLNVIAKPMYFTAHTNIDNYDFIVGQCPCSAIENIVKKSARRNKGYFLQLCNCTLPAGYESWEEVLPEYDSKIKFHLDYAYNLDASPSLVEKVIKKYDPHKVKLKTMPSISVSYIKDLDPTKWKIDDTPNEVAFDEVPENFAKNWECEEISQISMYLKDDRELQ